jgi:hypothetical protein
MIETISSLQHAALRTRLAQAAITLAQREAEKAVKLAAAVHREAGDRHHGEGVSRSASRADRRGEADHRAMAQRGVLWKASCADR